MVYFWYPAAKPGDSIAPYLPGARQMDAIPEIHNRATQDFGKAWADIVSGAISSHATERAPVAKGARGWPLVVFSHGLGSTSFAYTHLIESLVSQGYVVASIEHTHTAFAVWFPDGRVIPAHHESPPAELAGEKRSKWMMEQISEGIAEGAADIRFVLDRTLKMNADSKLFFLAGKMDLTTIAAMGHSAGAEYAARACQVDDRLKACVDLDGAMVPVAALPEYPDGATLKQPLLFLEAYHPDSQTGGSASQKEAYRTKKEQQLQKCPSGTYNVVIRSPGIAHPSFSDIPLLFRGENGYPEPSVALHNLDLIEKFVREFLGKNLKHEKAPLLDGPTNQMPEAIVQPYGT